MWTARCFACDQVREFGDFVTVADLFSTDDQPNAIHLFTFLPTSSATLPGPIELVVTLQLSAAVRHARWNPQRPRRLAASLTTGSAVYLWDGDWVDEDTEGGANQQGTAEAIALPTTAGALQPQDIRWAPDGEWLACVDRATFCVLYSEDR